MESLSSELRKSSDGKSDARASNSDTGTISLIVFEPRAIATQLLKNLLVIDASATLCKIAIPITMSPYTKKLAWTRRR